MEDKIKASVFMTKTRGRLRFPHTHSQVRGSSKPKPNTNIYPLVSYFRIRVS